MPHGLCFHFSGTKEQMGQGIMIIPLGPLKNHDRNSTLQRISPFQRIFRIKLRGVAAFYKSLFSKWDPQRRSNSNPWKHRGKNANSLAIPETCGVRNSGWEPDIHILKSLLGDFDPCQSLRATAINMSAQCGIGFLILD